MAYTKAPDADLLQAALIGYQRQHAVLEERMAEIRRELDGTAASSDAGKGKPRRGMSAAGRRRIAAAQRKRWAKLKKATPAKAKRKISAAGRKRMVEAVRKRWKAWRAAK
jgi:hypothetical protein